MKRLLLILIVVLTSGCASMFRLNSEHHEMFSSALSDKEKNDWKILTGKWYGYNTLNNGLKREWIIDRTNDGYYSVEFRTIDKDGIVNKQIENGEWGVSGNVYFTIFKSFVIDGSEDISDSTDPYNRDTYKVLKLNDKTFEYKHFRTGEKFRVIKVDSTFKLK